ncbi:nucleoside hydrolase [Deinococcus arenicola]|uniref:Nucleoside hydrolase n=1 Tax=Deinococcus arenicola TaxID=2994950 RepID=A0ABU4DUM8_9DEIO|nr:nucleoside hydrolase [Deinococcus sp. ZS9-10]MDV6376150.1 nucleoside hydrolase [Deinococcus sp. ZS9-10]
MNSLKVAPLKIILDGDPGLDDAVAWLLALASPEVAVLGITATHGNVGLPLTVRNAGITLALAGEAGAGVPYFAGADRPLVAELVSAASVHGDSGLPASDLPTPTRPPESEHAADFIIRTVREHPNEVTLVATGPLTNLALAFRLAPDLVPLVQEVIWMGGSTTGGNRTPAAEFNAVADPHAAHIVFESGVPLRMVGLNATMQCIADPDRIAALRGLGNRAGAVCAELLTFYAGVYRERYGLSGGALHDPLAVGAAIRPDLLDWQAMRVAIEVQEGLNFGRTVCDLYGVTGEPANARVAVGVRDGAFFALLLDRIGTLP